MKRMGPPMIDRRLKRKQTRHEKERSSLDEQVLDLAEERAQALADSREELRRALRRCETPEQKERKR